MHGRTKALLALSCLIRNNPEGLKAFLAAGGGQTLVSLLQQRDPANADARIERYVKIRFSLRIVWSCYYA